MKTAAPSKKDEKQFFNVIMEVINAVRRPKVVMPGYTDMPIPHKVEHLMFVERMLLVKNGEKIATETETIWYLSTASLVAPLDRLHYRIFMILFRKFCEKQKMEVPDFAREKIALEEYEEHLYMQLRGWLYRRGMDGLKARRSDK